MEGVIQKNFTHHFVTYSMMHKRTACETEAAYSFMSCRIVKLGGLSETCQEGRSNGYTTTPANIVSVDNVMPSR